MFKRLKARLSKINAKKDSLRDQERKNLQQMAILGERLKSRNAKNEIEKRLKHLEQNEKSAGRHNKYKQ